MALGPGENTVPTASVSGWWNAREIGGFAHARLELRVAIVSTHWAWPSCEGVWTALRRRRQFPSGGSESVDAPVESQGHLLGTLGSEGRETGTRDAPECMLAQCNAAWRHLHCRLYANLGQGCGHTSWTFVFIHCCSIFMVQFLLLFL